MIITPRHFDEHDIVKIMFKNILLNQNLSQQSWLYIMLTCILLTSGISKKDSYDQICLLHNYLFY